MTNTCEIPTRLYVKVTPKAKSARLTKEVLSDGSWLFKIAVTTAPEDGKANKAVLDALSKELKIPKSRLSITHGLLSREKIIRVASN
jgi:uncharacterized protein YggU (UPF0235/DUF167 family)